MEVEGALMIRTFNFLQALSAAKRVEGQSRAMSFVDRQRGARILANFQNYLHATHKRDNRLRFDWGERLHRKI